MRHSYRHLRRNGRLGNQLFQLAGTIGRAHRTGDIANAVFPRWPYEPYFSIPDTYFAMIDAGERTIDGGRAYLQNVSEFADCDEDIRRFFAPSPRAVQECSELLPGINDHHHVTAVHVRRGDYLSLPTVVTTCPSHYFLSAMHEIRARHPATHFNVYSDDPRWCEDNLGGPQDVTVILHDPTRHPILREMADFTAMCSSHAFIISNSTFSWWPAYLSESSDVICPDRWMNEGALVDIDALVLPGWQRRSIDPNGPMRTPLLVVSEGDAGYIVTDNRTQRVHHLNPVATLLFELCTGSNTIDDIASAMSPLIPDASWRTGLDDLIRLGLVTPIP